jgi:hypothetical protein
MALQSEEKIHVKVDDPHKSWTKDKRRGNRLRKMTRSNHAKLNEKSGGSMLGESKEE